MKYILRGLYKLTPGIAVFVVWGLLIIKAPAVMPWLLGGLVVAWFLLFAYWIGLDEEDQ